MAKSELNLYQRLHAITKEIGTISKNGRNNFHNYDYATEKDFVEALRPLLDKHGVAIVPELGNIPNLQSIGEKGDNLTSLIMKFHLINIDNPTEQTVAIVPGQGTDKGDKGIYKALTGAKKYFIALTFMVETGDDPEKDDKPAAGKKVSPKAKSKPAAKTETKDEDEF